MNEVSFKQIFLIITVIAITPFILFLGHNHAQFDFFTTNYFLLAVIYCLIFICTAVCANLFYKKILIFIFFCAYFGFLQFYFLDMQTFLTIYTDGSTGFYVLFFIVFISFIAAVGSISSIFRNFVLILLFLNIAVSMNNLIPMTVKSLSTFFNSTNITDNTSKIKNFTSVKYPNIFYIVPDTLASPKVLKSYADIDFKDSIKKFEEKGFSVPMHNYSSYNTTYLSLAALFKMDYPVREKSPTYKNRDELYPTIRERNPELLQYLKTNNYEFVIAPPMWGGCPTLKAGICLTPKGNFYIKMFFHDYAISNFLKGTLLDRILKKYKGQNEDMNDSIKTTLVKMKNDPKIWSEGGVFTMIHAYMPHTPYREENCSITDRYTTPSKEGYKSSVYCSFNRIHELSDFIIKNYPNATIVVQADHGPDIKINPEDIKFFEISSSYIDQKLSAFTAVRGCNPNQAAKLNQVNIVNYIVECLVGGTPTKQPENKSYWGFYETSQDFGKVFRVQQK